MHRLEKGRDLYIGGIKIAHEKGAVGHSDADVLIHAICDALLGALALRDIGCHFPDTQDKFKNIDSKILLQKVNTLIADKGYTVNNIDSTVCLQNPKIGPYIEKMRQTLAGVLNCPLEAVSVKATTTEKLGFVGTEEGISAYAVAIVMKR